MPLIQWTVNRTAVGLLTIASALCSTVSSAQLIRADHGAAAIDSHGLMWANTVGINLGWNPAGGPGTAQTWVANLNATDYGGFNDWTLATGDFNVGPNTTTNQLGELFYTDCGNTVGQQTALTIPGNNCRALSALRSAMQAGTGLCSTCGFPGAILISSGTFLGPVFNYYSWAAYDTSNSSERYWDSDTSYNGVTGEGDVLAVRFAGTKPDSKNASVGHEFASRSVPEPGTLALFAAGLIVLALFAIERRRSQI
jgi:hypothetical protein